MASVPVAITSWSVAEVKDWAEEHFGGEVADKFEGIPKFKMFPVNILLLHA